MGVEPGECVVAEDYLSSAHTAKKHKPVHYDEVDLTQMTLFDTVKDEDVLKELSEIDVSTLTPIEALNELYRLQNKLNNRWRNQ